MKYLMIFFSLFIFLFLFSGTPLGAPLVSTVSGSLLDGATLTIEGQDFGIKTTPTPRYYTDLEDETTGAIPTGWLVSAAGVVVSEARAWSGGKSLEATFLGVDDFSQIRRDIGETKTLFFSANIYFEKNDTCAGQWKTWRITSSPGAYSINEEITTTSFINDHWFYHDPDRWGNAASSIRYDGGTIGATISAPSDMFLNNQWQRIEQFVKGSSAASIADGYMWTRRVGRAGDLQSESNFISYDSDDKNWRYFMIGQAWGQFSDCATGDAKAYYDNIYIDDTQARVEIGDAAVWANCTHREIQIPTAWESDGTEITVTLSQGSLSRIGGNYLFVVDADGTTSAGFLLPGAEVGIGGTKEISAGGTKTITFH